MKRLPELDALRGIAALAVVVYHYVNGKVGPELQWLNIGCMGVDMFFIISGFVIFLSLSKLQTWQTFFRNRMIRLFPAYWASVTVTTILILLSLQSIYYAKDEYELTNNLLVKYAANMTMLNYYFRIGYIDGVYWSLTVELVFYIAMAFIIRFGALHLVEKIGAAALLACAAYSLDIVAANSLFHKILVLVPLLAYWPLFFAGILLYKMKSGPVTVPRTSLVGLTFVVQCALFKNCYHNTQYLTFLQYASTLSVIYGVFTLLLFDKLGFIVNPVTSWLGKISYSLYLLHAYIGINWIIPYLMKQHQWGIFPSAVTSAILVLCLAELVNRYVENPAAQYFKRKTAAPVFTLEPAKLEGTASN